MKLNTLSGLEAAKEAAEENIVCVGEAEVVRVVFDSLPQAEKPVLCGTVNCHGCR